MSDALITSLNEQLTSARGEAAKYRKGRREALGEVEALRKQVESLTAERDQFKQKAETTPNELQAKVEALTSEIRTRDHRDAFSRSVGGRLVDKADVNHVWQALNYQPGEAVPTPEQVEEQLGKAREAAPWLFREGSGVTPQSSPGGTTHGFQVPATQPPPGSGRSDSGTSSGRFVVSPQQMGDPAWMQANQQRIADAYASGALVVG